MPNMNSRKCMQIKKKNARIPLAVGALLYKNNRIRIVCSVPAQIQMLTELCRGGAVHNMVDVDSVLNARTDVVMSQEFH